MSSFCFRLLASLLFVALGCGQSPAWAADLGDCSGAALERIEASCTAIINDPKHISNTDSMSAVRRP